MWWPCAGGTPCFGHVTWFCFSRRVEVTHWGGGASSMVRRKLQSSLESAFLKLLSWQTFKRAKSAACFSSLLFLPGKIILSRDKPRKCFITFLRRAAETSTELSALCVVWTLGGEKFSFSVSLLICYPSAACLIELWEVISSNKTVITGYCFYLFLPINLPSGSNLFMFINRRVSKQQKKINLWANKGRKKPSVTCNSWYCY